jgi:hypothetical protein
MICQDAGFIVEIAAVAVQNTAALFSPTLAASWRIWVPQDPSAPGDHAWPI